MGHYLLNFSVYTLAMIGLIFFALFIYKKIGCADITGKKRGNLKVDDYLSLSPRKTLYVVSSGNEKFLIASDAERTTLISKLENGLEPDFSNLDAVDEHNKLLV